MASVEAKDLSKADHDELCCSYAALMLHDDGLEITVSYLLSPYNSTSGRKIERRYQGFRKRSRAILANALRQGTQGC